MKDDLLFYNEYEQFYQMAKESRAFKMFCEEAFGRDFSQDGFGDVSQVDRVVKFIPDNAHILDIGCGNGKMLGYLQERTGAHIYGFDYSAAAISAAQEMFTRDSEFTQGAIGEVDYPEGRFDVITSMDSMYFAPDMKKFVAQLLGWLKDGGTFFVCYQEGDVMPKTSDVYTTELARAFQELNITYEYEDITRESYDLLIRKRDAALKLATEFEREGHAGWLDMLIDQTTYANCTFEEFKKEMARYVYIVRR